MYLILQRSPLYLLAATLLLVVGPAFADDQVAESSQAIDTVWVATAAALVFLMQAGFALIESGSSRAKNCINVVMKNYMDVCIGSLAFWLLGFGLMFGANSTGFIGTSHFALGGDAASWDYSFLLFQTMFAATAATITSGAMAERAKYSSYLVVATLIMLFIYPVFGSWAWGSYYEGSGWLSELGFIDFAGSSVVHSVGGWSALAAIIVLGPRLGRFSDDGKVREIPGHNLNLVALGGFILWFGWFGFNGGSTVSADVNIGLINLNTQLGAAAGAVGALLMSVLMRQPIFVGTIVNGSLAGLVAITAGCASMSPPFAVITSLIGGMIFLFFNRMLLAYRVDDVVGAVAVHGFAGAWGTLCAGMFLAGDIFNIGVIFVQLVGIISCFIWTFSTSYLLFSMVNKLMGLRVDPLHEQRGLDFTEHAEVSYPEFTDSIYYNKQNLKDIER